MITTRTVEFSYLEEQLILCKLLEGKEIDVTDVQENIEATFKLTKGERYAVMTDGRVNVTITKEGLEAGARPEVYIRQIAHAIVVTSIANRLIGNFIINFHKPPSPTKLFSNPESALVWLRKCIVKEKRRQNKHSHQKNDVEINAQ